MAKSIRLVNVDKIIDSNNNELTIADAVAAASAGSGLDSVDTTGVAYNEHLVWDSIAQEWVGESQISPPPTGEAVFTTPGTYSWTAPYGVTSVCVVCVGGGGGRDSGYKGGAGGNLAWSNDVPVVEGTSYTISVGNGGTSSSYQGGISTAVFGSNTTRGNGGGHGTAIYGDGGGHGGPGGSYGDAITNSGAGGAGGYTDKGGKGEDNLSGSSTSTRGLGGGGSGGGKGSSTSAGGGGGVGLFGEGASGVQVSANQGGKGGSGGGDGTSSGNGGLYGGGGAGTNGLGGHGAVRIIWGEGRSFPNNAA